MSEELIQRGLSKVAEKIGTWDYYNIGATTINQLKEAGIIRSVDYGKDIGRKKVDGIIVKSKEVIAIIEHKQPSSFNTQSKKEATVLQEMEVARKLRAKLIIATDGQETIWVNVETGNSVKDEKGLKISYKFDSKDEKIQSFIKKILDSINNHNDRILSSKIVNPTNLAKQIWQDIWSVSGATPENSLYSFVELFIFKYLSDLNILKGDFSFYSLIAKYEDNDESEVLDLYAKNIRPKIKDLFPENPIDKTTIINGAVFVDKEQKSVSRYSLVFKKILRRFHEYGKLDNIDYDFKSKLFESFLKESISKKNWGQFFTPIKVVKAINKMAVSELREGIKVCDPACGVGKFPLELIKEKINEFFPIEGNKIKQKIEIIGFDKGFDEGEQKIIILAKANMLIYFCDLIRENKGMTKKFAELFNRTFILKTKSILGTLSEIIRDEYHLILTNPPYVTSGVSNLKKEILSNPDLKKYYKISATGVEGLFMEWIVRALKPNGKAFVVVPDGILERSSDKKLRGFILENCYIDAIISLPVNTFFTTQKKTSILVITKKNNNATQEFPVFTYLVSEIGESRNVNRFDIDQDDLTEAVELFNFYKGNKKSFQEFQHIKPDSRCKIIDINEFEFGSKKVWKIENWWTKEELIELGIVEKEKKVSLKSFGEIILEVSEKLKNFALSMSKIEKDESETINFEEALISDIFEIKKGSAGYTKKFINENPGEYPVYSSQTTEEGIIGRINSYDYDCECLTWTTNGVNAGTVFLRNGKFSLSTNCGALMLKPISKNKNILLNYIYYYLLDKLSEYAIGEQNKIVTVEIIKNIPIKIPSLNGIFSREWQQKLIEKYQYIEKLRDNIKADKKIIHSLIVDAKEDGKFLKFSNKKISLTEIFNLSYRTNNSSFTKSFIQKNKGNIPVYSASKEENNVDYGYVEDNLNGVNYFENCLTLNIDGSVGKIFLRAGRFTLSEKVIPLIINEYYEKSLDKKYLKYTLEDELMKRNFGFTNKPGKDKIKDIEIEIPTDKNGDFCLENQKLIAETCEQIEEIKRKISSYFKEIERNKIDIS